MKKELAAPAVPLQQKVSKAFNELRPLRDRTEKARGVDERTPDDLERQKDKIRKLTEELAAAEGPQTTLVRELHREVPAPPSSAPVPKHNISTVGSLLKQQEDNSLAGPDLEGAERHAAELRQSLQGAVRSLLGDALSKAKAFQAEQAQMLRRLLGGAADARKAKLRARPLHHR